jgi:hypothetical protein
MITEVLTDGSHVRVQELAEDMAVSQAAEINRLARL